MNNFTSPKQSDLATDREAWDVVALTATSPLVNGTWFDVQTFGKLPHRDELFGGMGCAAPVAAGATVRGTIDNAFDATLIDAF